MYFKIPIKTFYTKYFQSFSYSINIHQIHLKIWHTWTFMAFAIWMLIWFKNIKTSQQSKHGMFYINVKFNKVQTVNYITICIIQAILSYTISLYYALLFTMYVYKRCFFIHVNSARYLSLLIETTWDYLYNKVEVSISECQYKLSYYCNRALVINVLGK